LDPQVTPGGQPEEDHLDDLLQDDPLQGDPHQDATDALGPPLALRTPAIPEMTVMLMVHSHVAFEKLLSPAD